MNELRRAVGLERRAGSMAVGAGVLFALYPKPYTFNLKALNFAPRLLASR
jgi:hypothetical protein